MDIRDRSCCSPRSGVGSLPGVFMQPLDPVPQCTSCLTALARDAASLATGGDPEFMDAMEKAARELLPVAQNGKWTSPQIANHLLRQICRKSGNPDPYRKFKDREMEQARKIFSRIKPHLSKDLRGCVQTAVAGNSFDFFKDPETLWEDILRSVNGTVPMAFDHLDRLEAFLGSGKRKILYFSDNAGEIFFDMPLFAHLEASGGTPTLVVKGGSALNDLTRSDLARAGLIHRFSKVEDTGTDGVGIEWGRASERFLAMVKEADLILAKGMANFETIFPRDLPCPALFLFRVKCEPVRRYISAPGDSGVVLWKEAGVT